MMTSVTTLKTGGAPMVPGITGDSPKVCPECGCHGACAPVRGDWSSEHKSP